MGWDNAGGYNRQHNFSADASANIKILASRMDAELDDVASAMTIALTRNGQNAPTGNLPMGGFRHINVAAAVSVNNYMRVREFIENIPIYMHDQESSADRISVSAQYFTSVSANQAPGDGTRILVRVASNKTSAALYLNGHSANVELLDGSRTHAMTSGGVYEFVYSSTDAVWKATQPDRGRTAAEISAGVVPSDFSYPPGDIRRYGASTAASAATNTTAIQNAINVAEVGGASVYVPAGTYSITALTHDSTNGITIYGDGYQSCLQGANAGTAILLLVQHASFTAINGFRMANIRFDANSGGQLDAGAIQINNAIGFVLDQVWVENATRTSGASGVNGIAVSVGSTGNTGPIGVIRNCYVRNTSKGGINVTSESVGVIVDGCTIRDITGNGTAPGIQINGAFGSRIVNNLIFNTEGRGVFIATDSLSNYPKYTVVANNVIHDTGTGASEGDGIVLSQSTGSDFGRIIIANNHVYNSGVNVTAYGIYLNADANVTLSANHIHAASLYGLRIQNCTDVTVTGNTIDACNTSSTALVGGIRIDGTCDRITIVGNKSTDSSGSPKQVYGLECAASAVLTRFVISDNNFYGNVTAPVAFNSTPKQSTIRVVMEKQTTDGSANTALVFVLADQTSMSVKISSTAEQSDFSNRAFYTSEGLFYRSGGGAVVQGSINNITTIESAAGWGGNAVDAASNSAVVQVQGTGATTINWRVQIEAQTV